MNRKYILKKFINSLITIFFVLIINYFLFRVVPGNPISILVRNAHLTPVATKRIMAEYGLDQPWYLQFLVYLRNTFTGDMGTSFIYNKPAADIIWERIPATLLLTIPAEIASILIGCYIGIVSAWRRGRQADVIGTGVSMFFYAMPTFWLGILLIAFFSGHLCWFPTSGMNTIALTQTGWVQSIPDVLWHLFLPFLTLTLVMLGNYTLVMRNSLTDVLTEDYITTAYAKGMTAKRVLKKHAIPNALIPVTTLITMNLGFTVSGALQIETVFSWPGIGRLMYDALEGRDYPLLQGIFLIISVCVIGANFLSDILYSYMDPRVKS